MWKSLVVISFVAACATPPAPTAPTTARLAPDAPELVGAVEGVELGAKPITIDIALRPATNPGANHAYLNLEHVVGTGSLASYQVYVNLPDGTADLAAFRAGSMPMFGVREASEHGGTGLTYVLDITKLVESLEAAHAWSPDHMRVTFAPGGTTHPAAKARIGRVSLFMATK